MIMTDEEKQMSDADFFIHKFYEAIPFLKKDETTDNEETTDNGFQKFINGFTEAAKEDVRNLKRRLSELGIDIDEAAAFPNNEETQPIGD